MARAMLYTRCPECRTTFRITEQILQKADGQVRCGRCAHVFDANVFLHDPLKSAADAATVSGRALDRILETETDVTRPEPGTSAPPADTTSEQPGSASKAAPDGGKESSTGDDTAAEAKRGAAGAKPGAAGSAAMPGPSAAVEVPDGGEGKGADGDGDGDSGGTGDRDPEEADGSSIVRAVRDIGLPAWWPELTTAESHRRAWTIAAAVLGAILLIQLTHHFRAGLARVPVMGSAVTALYGIFGSDLARYDLDQYVILDSAAVAQPDAGEHGWLLIEARLRNSGPRVQPYPHFFLTLEDRWQDNIAGRYFAPEEYLTSPVSDSSRMGVGEVVDAQFIIVDPGPEASGFEVDVCMQLDDGFACASDLQLD